MPKILTRIEAENDEDSFTPVFKKHKENLRSFGTTDEKLNDPKWCQLQRHEFHQSKVEFARNEERSAYIGLILNNWGLGEG